MSARFEQATTITMERSFGKHETGLFGYGFGCKCLPDVVVQPASILEAAMRHEDRSKRHYGLARRAFNHQGEEIVNV
jgi:hypothetical protein